MAWTRSIIGTFFWLVTFLMVAWGATVAFLMWQQNNEAHRFEVLGNYYITAYEAAHHIMSDLQAMGDMARAANGATSPVLRQDLTGYLHSIAHQLGNIRKAEEQYGDGASGAYRRLLNENRNFETAMAELLPKEAFGDGVVAATQRFQNRVEQFYLLRKNRFLALRGEGRSAADAARKNALLFLAVVLVIGGFAVRYAKREIGAIATRDRRAAQAVRESEERYRQLVERMNEGLAEFDRETRITYVNDYFCKMLGYSREELMHRLTADFLDDENLEKFEKTRDERKRGSARSYEFSWTRKDGSQVQTLVAPEPLYDDVGEFVGSLAVFTDITELKRQNELLQQSEERFRSLAEAGAIGIWQIDANNETLYVNPAMCAIVGVEGLEDFKAKPYLDFFTPEAAAQVARERSKRVSGTATTYETELRRADSQVRSVIMSGSPLFLEDGTLHSTIGSVIDTTERHALEERLRRSQKMEAVGQLTGGIAHEFNNLLQVVVGNLELLEAAAPADNVMDRRFQAIHRNVARGAELTDRLLSFSRRQPLAPRAVEIPKVFAEMQGMLVQTLGETIKVAVEPAVDLWTAEADPGQLENALLNLALNARDAMPAGGAITLSAANIGINETAAAVQEDRQAGDYVVLCVADEGSGMSAEARARAFEPFFTTKEVGKGTGLGLSMVYGFAQQSGGFAEIESEPGQGTRVRIYLPRLVAAADEAVEVADDGPADGTAAAEALDQRTILLVEDDTDVRGSLCDQLTDLGYRVIEAEDGHDALALFDGSERIDLLFTDIVMPGGINGLDLARRLREHLPALNVIYTTGYSDDILAKSGPLDDGAVVLRKPYNSKAMTAALERAMSG